MQNERDKIVKLLEGAPLYSNHSQERHPLLFESISRRGVAEINVNSGGVECNLLQFIYIKHGIALKYANFPCFIHKHSLLGIDIYYPLEITLIDK